ncbi:hypothetical protein FGF80_02810 [Natrinema pallidum]|uniref:Uncharacterized protein n=1 Tax=Natrinema pallidum TaxID=69527 RepID=A0A4P9TCL0_9EURY|nr:hypothetical protein FGF80_02810 [Natrinema pallidum]
MRGGSIAGRPTKGTTRTALLRRLGIGPETIAETALHRCKSPAETGGIPALETTPSTAAASARFTRVPAPTATTQSPGVDSGR